MAIEDRFSEMSAQELNNLLGNASRLAANGALLQKAEAERLLPLINAELASRRPAPAARTRAKSAAKSKKS
ncbi:MAG TPA: hypothetical protein VG943_14825 [Caulobacterales bacterium]|nr:hypothetical protein [Caulobacterales bacterium]